MNKADKRAMGEKENIKARTPFSAPAPKIVINIMDALKKSVAAETRTSE